MENKKATVKTIYLKSKDEALRVVCLLAGRESEILKSSSASDMNRSGMRGLVKLFWATWEV